VTLLQWISLAGVCLAGAASPGPSLLVVVRANLAGGRGAGLAAAWAHALGVGVYALLTVLGISALLRTAPSLFSALQFCAALYLLYLASGLLRGSAAPAATDNPASSQHYRAALEGFAMALLNPKLGLFMLALFSQFLRPHFGPAEQALMVVTALTIDGCWYSLVTLLLTREGWLEALRARGGLIDRLLGTLLAAVAVYLILLGPWRP
jgi:threonine/homoserine/homoserine lactone efflux protein